jgi:hypothetical protein
MVDKKKMSADLDKVGQVIATAKNAGSKLTPDQVTDSKKTLGVLATELFRMRAQASTEVEGVQTKRAALKKSSDENMISRDDSAKEARALMVTSATAKTKLAQVQEAIDAIKRLAAEVSKLAASPELEKLDKGHASSEAIKAPQKASASKKTAVEQPAEQLKGEGKIVPELKSKEIGLKPQDSEPISQGKDETLEEGVPEESNKKGEATGDAIAEPTVTASRKARAGVLLKKAMELIATADKETDATKKATTMRRAAMLEKMADHLTSTKKATVAKTASVEKAAETKEAAIPTLASNDQVLLADGSIGTVKSVYGDKAVVSVAGVDKEIIAMTCKKVNATAKVEEKKPVSSSIADKISAAVATVRASKKVKADELPADASPAAVPGSETKPASGASTVQTLKSNAATFNPNTNKWEVAESSTKIMEFPDEESAKGHIAAKKTAAEKPEIIDSANPKAPDSQEDVVKNLKGLDQQGKDYGKTEKSEKMDEQQGPVGHVAAKTATTDNPGQPVDSATQKASGAEESIVSKIRGLTQDAKGYKSTTKEQVMDPKLGPLKEVTAAVEKARILELSNKKMSGQLAIAVGKLLTDRAVKVGAISEANRAEQETIMAELHQNSPSEFNAYARLIANLEKQAGETPTLANRGVKRVEAALQDRKSRLVDATTPSTKMGSLDEGTLFEDEN